PTVGFQNNFQSKVNILNAYPQPTSDMLNVEYTAEKGLTLITLSEISGRVLIRQTHANVTGKNSLQLDLSKVARGVYLLNVQTNGSNNQMSIVVE
ncbi:MAG TPA: T9SS type A sorting domain-containing protein, partial [Bacteroidia bacterium]|nr:T9SS type A sorting domain-containing protein [Bacteroidia bacterium]